MTDILIAILFVSLYGVFKFCTDIWRDQHSSNLLYHLSRKWSWLARWYDGDAQNGYTQRNPLQSDFWHTMDDCKLYLLVVALLLWLGFNWWESVLLAILFVGTSGRIFALGYTFWLPDVKTHGGVKTWLLNCLFFWRAENK